MIFYRVLLTLSAPVVAIWFALRLLRGRETGIDLRERLGLDGPPEQPAGRVIWIHGASNGELTSARNLIEALLADNPAQRLVVTANSVTGRDMVRDWNLPGVRARLAPLDYRICLQRFIEDHGPDAFLLLEGDLWPNRHAVCAKRGIGVALISARISARSARRWRRIGRLGRQVLGAVGLLSAQDAASEQRFRDLGVPPGAIHSQVTLKSTVSLDRPDARRLAEYRTVFDRAETLLAASTHDGEEQQVIDAFAEAREARPELKMILAPRHPVRGSEVARLLEASGLAFRQRSRGAEPEPGGAIYLADTLGEMPLWYALAGQCFVGGSLVSKGGHTPYEPAQFDCAILHGPDLSNFAEQYAKLEAANGAIKVTDSATLAAALTGLSADDRARMCRNARSALELDATASGLATLVAALSGFPVKA